MTSNVPNFCCCIKFEWIRHCRNVDLSPTSKTSILIYASSWWQVVKVLNYMILQGCLPTVTCLMLFLGCLYVRVCCMSLILVMYVTHLGIFTCAMIFVLKYALTSVCSLWKLKVELFMNNEVWLSIMSLCERELLDLSGWCLLGATWRVARWSGCALSTSNKTASQLCPTRLPTWALLHRKQALTSTRRLKILCQVSTKGTQQDA